MSNYLVSLVAAVTPTSPKTNEQTETAPQEVLQSVSILKNLEIAKYFLHSETITSLTITGAKLPFIPKELSTCVNITTLNLSKNLINCIPLELLLPLKSLVEVDVSFNQVNQVTTPASVQSIGAPVTNLILHHNQLEDLQQLLNFFNKLTTLDASYNQLKSLPANLADMSTLTRVNFSNNLFGKEFQAVMPSSLTECNLSCNEIVTLSPATITSLSQVIHLNLSCNERVKVTDDIQKLSQLQQLHLNMTKVRQWPPSITSLTNLQELYLRDCRGFTVHFNKNHHESVCQPPDLIFTIPNLRKLDMSGSSISTIQDAISQLTNLEELILNDCTELITLPKVIIHLPKLKNIELNNCNKLEIPTITSTKYGLLGILGSLNGNFLPPEEKTNCIVQ